MENPFYSAYFFGPPRKYFSEIHSYVTYRYKFEGNSSHNWYGENQRLMNSKATTKIVGYVIELVLLYNFHQISILHKSFNCYTEILSSLLVE